MSTDEEAPAGTGASSENWSKASGDDDTTSQPLSDDATDGNREFDPSAADAALTDDRTPFDVGAAHLEAGGVFRIGLVRWLMSKGCDQVEIGVLAQTQGVSQEDVVVVANELSDEDKRSLVEVFLRASTPISLPVPAVSTEDALTLKLPNGVELPRAIMVGEDAVVVQAGGLGIRKHDKTVKPICNFVAIIVEYRIRDDGFNAVAEYGIDVSHLGQCVRVYVNAQDFADLGWLPVHVGPTARVYPRCREIVKVAIQALSEHLHRGLVPRTTVYGHLGWRQLPDGQRVFLTAAGALGPNGIVPGVEVGLPGDFSRYFLDEVTFDDELRVAVRASLSILELGADVVTVPVLASTYLAPLGQANGSVFLEARTGSQKTCMAALAQQHFGPEMDYNNLPAHWSSTENALEMMEFVAKDCQLVIDDYNPQGSATEQARWHAKADRVLRAAANSSGRSRLGKDSELQETRPARCLVLATGEDMPKGQSLRGRILAVEMHPGGIDLAKLTVAQEEAVSGVYAKSMAGYIQWLAADWDRVERVRKERSSRLRSELHDIGSHPFTATIVADLGGGVRIPP